jgi:hypothetical protein
LKESAYFSAMAYQLLDRNSITRYLKQLNPTLAKAAKEGSEKELADEKVSIGLIWC